MQFSINRIDAGEKYHTSAPMHSVDGSWEVTPPMRQRGELRNSPLIFFSKDT
jgi:hypothetical protein